MAESLTVQMNKILDEYDEHIQKVTNETFRKKARQAASTLRSTSPKRPGGGSYAAGWSAKRLGKIGRITSMVVYNKTNYQLTHLLENGHVIRNKYGEYGRTTGKKHIAPVADRANSEIPLEIERQL